MLMCLGEHRAKSASGLRHSRRPTRANSPRLMQLIMRGCAFVLSFQDLKLTIERSSMVSIRHVSFGYKRGLVRGRRLGCTLLQNDGRKDTFLMFFR